MEPPPPSEAPSPPAGNSRNASPVALSAPTPPLLFYRWGRKVSSDKCKKNLAPMSKVFCVGIRVLLVLVGVLSLYKFGW